MNKFDTLFNHILSEQEYDPSQFNPRLNKADVSNRPTPDYSEPKDDLNNLRNRERNAGLEPQTKFRFNSSSYKYKIGDTYEKNGTKFIIARNEYTGRIGPQLVTFLKGGEGKAVEYKVTGVDDKGYPISEPTGVHQKLLPPTQWGVKDVPGGDID
jgi:hypothetical protein